MWHSFDEAGRWSQAWVDASAESLAALSKGAQAIAAETTEYARKSFEAGSRTVGEIASAGSVDEAIVLELHHSKRAYDDLVAQATTLAQVFADMVRHASRPYESLLTRMR